MKIKTTRFLFFLLIFTLSACNSSSATLQTEPAAKKSSDEALLLVDAGVPPAERDPLLKPHDGEPNRLIDEKSPYLLQHAYNPVDWYAWGEEAFAAARAQNKPIFLSIGYSTCHWCHVMEDESFEDAEVAALMNDAFISIKVDREERPDIDQIYMNVAMLMNGSGGWPLNIIMTPEQQPFFAGTYIPKEARFGRPGMLELIPQIQAAWQNETASVLDLAERVTEAVQATNNTQAGDALGTPILDSAYQQMSAQFDPVYGGFGTSPKFPTPHNLLYLLRYWQRSGDDEALQIVETTLQQMRLGGIYDQVGFGFHRYSTDQQWLVPHFEKMLYDQALIAMAYTETYLATGDPQYEQTAREIFAYVMRDMQDADGGFYSAENADSEGLEGKYYVWKMADAESVLSADEFEFVQRVFGVAETGDFGSEIEAELTDANILHLSQSMTSAETTTWASIRSKLYAARETRIRPSLDDKVLTDWNGLMIAALAKGGQAFDEPAYTAAAQASADFILQQMLTEDGRLLHSYRDGTAAISGTLEDYAYFTWGLIDLYEATFDITYLQQAVALQDQLIAHFGDPAGGFYMTADDGEALLTRPKEIYDGALPSGNSVAAYNLIRLGRVTGNITYEQAVEDLGRAFSTNVNRGPMGHTMLLNAIDFGVGPSLEIAIIGEPGAADTQAMIDAVRAVYAPRKVVLLRELQDDGPITQIADFTKYQFALDDKATAYVCLNYVCKQPTTDPQQMLTFIEETINSGQ